MEMVQDEVVIEEPAPIDFDWCEETSNCGDLILDQDIPTSLEEEVITNSGTEAEDEMFNETKSEEATTENDPAHAKMYPGKISVTSSNGYELHNKIRTISVSSNNPRSLLKKNLLANIERPPTKFRKTLMVNKSLLKTNNNIKVPNLLEDRVPPKITPAMRLTGVNNIRKIIGITMNSSTIEKPSNIEVQKRIIAPTIESPPSRPIKDAPKFRQTIKLQNQDLFQNKNLRQLTKKLRHRNHGSNSQKTDLFLNKKSIENDSSYGSSKSGKSGSTSGKTKGSSGGKGKRGKKFVDLHGENITINHDVESGSTLDPRKIEPIDTSLQLVSSSNISF